MQVRIDTLKTANSDFSCEKTRKNTKRCKPETNGKKATKGTIKNTIILRYKINKNIPQNNRNFIITFFTDRSNKKSGKQQ